MRRKVRSAQTTSQEDHESPEPDQGITRKRRRFNFLLEAVMEMKWEGLKTLPQDVGEIVVSEKASVEMASFPVKAKASRTFLRHPDVYKTSIANEEAKL